MSDDAPLLILRAIHKSFGNLEVLRGVDLTIGHGEIVALVGDNGAGKSTLIKIITGVHRASSGEIHFKGRRVAIRSVRRSRELGIEAVYQERALADQQSLWRNIFAGRELTKGFGFLDVGAQKRETERLLRDYIGFTSAAIDIEAEVKSLSGGEKQGVAIARALHFNAELIILDEPTMGLALSETDRVLEFVRGIRRRGSSAIIIDHNIFHVYDVADRFVILDRGRVAGEFAKSEITRDGLIARMTELHHTGAAA